MLHHFCWLVLWSLVQFCLRITHSNKHCSHTRAEEFGGIVGRRHMGLGLNRQNIHLRAIQAIITLEKYINWQLEAV